jgi:ABC-2 type transport system ATP-binding protein
MVEVRSVSKRYGNTLAARDISFAAREGEIFGLIGPNGAGKTTVIRIIMNILAPDSGQVLFDGRPLTQADKSQIGYLPEERGLYPKVTVIEHLRYFCRLKGSFDAESRIRDWLDRFGLADAAERKCGELSKGMAQKVQFISAVAHDPRILFFDEPFSGLDPVSVEVLREAITDLKSQGKTILFSTHIMEQAERLCNRLFLMNRGREIVSGPLAEVKARYGKRSVALEFDGDGDFLRSLPAVREAIEYPRYVELSIAEGHSADEILREIAGKLSVSRFEVMSPSLHRIFLDLAATSEEEVV